jgi:hypothetical protein
MSTQPNEKIWAVSMAPGSKQVPVHVSKRLKGKAGWKVQQMKEVGDPEPYKTVGRPTKAESAKIARLEEEKAALMAQIAELTAKPTKGTDANK